MKIFALSDPHLGFAVNKPMSVFGDRWIDHPEKIRAHWEKLVSGDDIVLVPGDISWGMNYREAAPDLEFLDRLPGSKYICRGNHDYWWTSRKQVSEHTGPSITVMQRNAVRCPGFVLAASKGWSTPLWEGYKPSSDDRYYRRELARMQMALEESRELLEPGKPLVYMMHYPPVVDGRPSEFAEYLAEYGVSLCVYGHLHGSWPEQVNMEYRGVVFRIASADYLNFTPLDLTGEVFH
jgi:predicted phosphohydrolase